MNIFAEKGIRDVADIMIYSINRIGTEEFYLPVLYLDYMKLTNFAKSSTTIDYNGGIANAQIGSWSYTKDIKLKAEDALFSQASLSMFLNGQLQQKMSTHLSAAAKLTVANKYGRCLYSTKAYPSPELTDEEWEIVYRCAEKMDGKKYTYSEEDYENEGVAENRWKLKQYYTHRNQPYFIKNLGSYLPGLDKKTLYPVYEDTVTFARIQNGTSSWNDYATYDELNLALNSLPENEQLEIRYEYTINKDAQPFSPGPTLRWLIKGTPLGPELVGLTLGNGYGSCSKELMDNYYTYLFPDWWLKKNDKRYWCYFKQNACLAMPQHIIDEIYNEIEDYTKSSYQKNSLRKIKKIDDFQLCTVDNINGLKIDLHEQKENVKKMNLGKDENYTIYYDAKTMMPFTGECSLPDGIYDQLVLERVPCQMSIEEVKEAIPTILRYTLGLEEPLIISPNEVIITNQIKNGNYMVYTYYISKKEYITLKYGTTYYKKTHTVSSCTDETFLGISIPIDYDTFSGEYLITGKTLVKDQATGKDSPCQLIINRAKISASVTLNLNGKGEPATFPFDIAILDPIDTKKEPVELIFYNTEKDEIKGGERIVPQSEHYARTPVLQTKAEVIAANEEIY